MTKDDLELLIFLLPTPESWDHRYELSVHGLYDAKDGTPSFVQASTLQTHPTLTPALAWLVFCFGFFFCSVFLEKLRKQVGTLLQ